MVFAYIGFCVCLEYIFMMLRNFCLPSGLMTPYDSSSSSIIYNLALCTFLSPSMMLFIIA